MTVKYVIWSYKRSPGEAGSAEVTSGGKREDGQEIWYVTSDGQTLTLSTTPTSAAAMDQATVLYDGALKRLAER